MRARRWKQTAMAAMNPGRRRARPKKERQGVSLRPGFSRAGREFIFQSLFACPVAKDQSTPDNPPMMLPCGFAPQTQPCPALFSRLRSRAPGEGLSLQRLACPAPPALLLQPWPSTIPYPEP